MNVTAVVTAAVHALRRSLSDAGGREWKEQNLTRVTHFVACYTSLGSLVLALILMQIVSGVAAVEQGQTIFRQKQLRHRHTKQLTALVVDFPLSLA